MNLRSRAYLNRFAYLNGGVDREEFATSACALNSTLIGMYKRNVLGSMRTHTLIHLNLFVRMTVSGFWHTLSFSKKSTQVFVRETPGVFITTVFSQLKTGHSVANSKNIYICSSYTPLLVPNYVACGIRYHTGHHNFRG